MKNLLILFFLLSYTLALLGQSPLKGASSKLQKSVSSQNYLPNTVIVKLKPAAASARTFSTNQFKTLSYVSSVTQKFPQTNAATSRTYKLGQADTIGLDRIFEIKIAQGTVEDAIIRLLEDPQVEYAEPSYIHRTSYIPTDPRFNQQDYLNLIQAPQAWSLVQNAAGVIIAIVDSGSELNHQDLAANIYYNTNDPINGVDDDNDGFIDNYYGWDLVGATSTSVPDNDPNVKNSASDHGVHVSGIAGAVTDNATGVAAISFNSAKLLIVKAAPDNDGTEILKGYEGIKYAADHGAKIINCSWGSNNSGSFGQDIINYALSKDCLIVAAAGNEGNSAPQYPAAYRGVLAVGNTQLNDQKSPSSNYGGYVALTAPGTGILSTVFGNRYDAYSGTSMASPVVAGAAALVKSAFPALNMQQVGELLRVTSDNIDDKNAAFAGSLGKGRLNVFRALTLSPPSVRIQKVETNERSASVAAAPDTLYLYLDVKNFLFSVNNLQITLSTNSPLVTVNVPQKILGSLATLEVGEVGPFKVLIPAGTPSNSNIDFQVNYSANNASYQDFESFSVVVAPDFLNLTSPSIGTTITSNGRIGFQSGSAKNGLGFQLEGEQLLFEASLMIGRSATMVSNNTRSTQDNYDEHFVKKVKAHVLSNNADSVKAASEFDDSNSISPLNVHVKQEMTIYQRAPDDNYAIVQYEVFNRNNTALNNLRIGLFTDWDIEGGGSNVTEYDAASRLGYIYNKAGNSKYGGVKLLSKNAPPLYYPLSFNVAGNPLSDENFTIAEKWETLSSDIKSTSLGTTTNGIDVFFVSGNGPYDIPANSSVKVAFALIGANSLQELKTSAQRAEVRYDLIQAADEQISSEKFSLFNYPNPLFVGAGTSSTVQFSIPQESVITLEIYNTLGQKVGTLFKDQLYTKGVYRRSFDVNEGVFSKVKSGIYFYRLRYSGGAKASKFSLSK